MRPVCGPAARIHLCFEPLQNPSSPLVRNSVLMLSAVLVGASLLGTALSPYLLVKNPFLLVVISPATHHIVLAAASVEPIPLVSVATVRRVLTGLGGYGLGYVYGSVVLEWLAKRSPRLARITSFVEGAFARRGVVLLVLAPVQTLALLAGAARSRLPYFLAAITLGNALWISLTVYLGDALSHWTDRLRAYLDQHLLESTLACVVAVGLQQVFARWRRARALATDKSVEPS